MQSRRNVLRNVICATAGLFVATGMLALAPQVDARPAPKVKIAHLAEVEEIIDEETGELLETRYKYVVIEVSENALRGHGNHEDALDGEALVDGTTFVADDYSRGDQILIDIAAETEPVTS